MYGLPDISGQVSGNISIHFLVNFLSFWMAVYILFNIGPINTKLEDFLKLDVLLLKKGCFADNLTIHRLVPRSSRYEICQCLETDVGTLPANKRTRWQ